MTVHSENHMKHTWGNVNSCGTQSNHCACEGQNPMNKQLKKSLRCSRTRQMCNTPSNTGSYYVMKRKGTKC